MLGCPTLVTIGGVRVIRGRLVDNADENASWQRGKEVNLSDVFPEAAWSTPLQP